MELCVEMQIVQESETFEGIPDLYIEEGDDQVSAVALPRFFNVQELAGCLYEEVVYTVDGQDCTLLQITLENNETILALAAKDDFDCILESIGLFPEEVSSIDFSILEQDVNANDELEKVA